MQKLNFLRNLIYENYLCNKTEIINIFYKHCKKYKERIQKKLKLVNEYNGQIEKYNKCELYFKN